MKLNGKELKRLIRMSGFKREQVVAHVQNKELSFCLRNLQNMCSLKKPTMPATDPEKICEAIVEKLSETIEVSLEDFVIVSKAA